MKKYYLSRFIRMGLIRQALKLFWLLPLNKKKVFFSAYEGKQFSCNPRAVFEGMRGDPAFSDYVFVWELNDPAKRSLIDDRRVRFVSHNSFRYVCEILTSGVLITNSGITALLPIRKKQLSINTWHGGGAFKRVGYAIKTDMSGDLYELSVASRQTTCFLSSSRIFTEVMVDSVMLPPERFAPTGMPRNDVLQDGAACEALARKIRAGYGLDADAFIALYAPTYHGAVGEDTTDRLPFDAGKLREALQKRFGRPAVVMVRLHYFNRLPFREDGVLSVSDYPDMQELLAAADMLITDYSSSIWDFSLTGKPCVLYAPDLGSYDEERGFYTPPGTWPGLLCVNDDEMRHAIETFDGAGYRRRVDAYLRDSGSYDCGDATAKVIEMVRENRAFSEKP